ncbi:MAG: glycosyltransferase [Planctomycetales bacterium]
MSTSRILQIIPSLDRAGAEKQLTLLASRLPRDEVDGHACAQTCGGPSEKDLPEAGISVQLIGKHWKVDPVAFWKLLELVRKLQPDLVQTWLFSANAYGRAAARLAGVRSIVASEQCADSWKGWHQLATDRLLAAHTSKIVVNGSGVRDFYIANGIDPEKIALIPNGIAPHQPGDRTREQILAELSLPADAKLVGAIGRLWPQKRIRDVIWAGELLTVVRDDVHVIIIGDGPERHRLERFRNNVQLRGRVHFLGHRNDVPQWIEHFDAVWLASAYEGLPNVIMEAMAAGVPVVATDIPGNRDLVVHNKTGYLYPVGDRAALAGWTNQLLENRDEAQSMGSAAQEALAGNYEIQSMVDQHADLYRELLNQPVR